MESRAEQCLLCIVYTYTYLCYLISEKGCVSLRRNTLESGIWILFKVRFTSQLRSTEYPMHTNLSQKIRQITL